MARYLSINLFLLVLLGLVLSACTAQSTSLASSTTATSAVSSVSAANSQGTSTLTTTLTSGASTTTVTTDAPAATRAQFCPWASCPAVFPVEQEDIYCNILVQVPSNWSMVFEYPVFVYNNNYTTLYRTQMLSVAQDAWPFNVAREHLHLKSIPVVLLLYRMGGTKGPLPLQPTITYPNPQYAHDRPWVTWENGPPMLTSTTSFIYRTSFVCRVPDWDWSNVRS